MNFKITSKKYVEQSNHINELTSVFTHTSKDQEIKVTRGLVFTVVNLNGPSNLDAASATNVFLDRFESEYFSTILASIPTILEKSTRNALFALNGYFEEKQFLGDDIIFDFACVAIKEDILYVGKVESGNIFLIRNNKSLDIGKSLSDISNPKLVDYGSGELLAGDKIIIANAVADEVITDWPLLSRYSELEINRLIQPGMHGDEKMAFLIIEVEHDESKVEKRYIDTAQDERDDASTPYSDAAVNDAFYDANYDEKSKFELFHYHLLKIYKYFVEYLHKLIGKNSQIKILFTQIFKKNNQDDGKKVAMHQLNENEEINTLQKKSLVGTKLILNLKASNGTKSITAINFKNILLNKFMVGGVASFLIIFFL